MKICYLCGKKPLNGNRIATRGLPKKTGGIGLKTTGITKRRFLPNLQRVKAVLDGGTVRFISVCTSCIQAGKVKKAPKQSVYRKAQETKAA